jgi:hypothetical protein
LLPGTILRTNLDTEFPNHNLEADKFVEVLQAELRTVAALLNMPEWMLTAKADAKYNNAFIAESPALKEFETIQSDWCDFTGNSRYSFRTSLMWRAVKNAIRAGVLPPEVIYYVKLVATGPPLETRDKQSEALSNDIYIKNGVKSVKLVQKELNLTDDINQLSPSLTTEQVVSISTLISQVADNSVPMEAAKKLAELSIGLPTDIVNELFDKIIVKPVIDPNVPVVGAKKTDTEPKTGDSAAV